MPQALGGKTMQHFLVFLFAMTGGFAASGILANAYRLVAPKPETSASKSIYYAIMVVAGPTVLFDNAAKSWRAKSCSALAFWLAAALAAYWSLIIGLFGISLLLAI
jgi:hypothetical protein